MKKRKIAIFILAIVTLSVAVGGAVATWVTGARLDGNQITTGSISLKVTDGEGGTIPMSKQLNWVDVDYSNADYAKLNEWAEQNNAAKADFSIENTSGTSLNVAVTFDTSNYTNAEGVDDCIVAWLYQANTAIVDGLRASQLTSTYKYSAAFEAGETRSYTLFMLTPTSLQNGFAADKTYRFDVVATGTLGEVEPPALVALKVDTTGAKTEYEIGETFSHAGIVVTGYYSDGSSEEITEGYTVSEPDMTKPGIKTITVSYEGMEATYDIKVAYVQYTGEELLIEAEDALLEGSLSPENDSSMHGGKRVSGIRRGDKLTFLFESTVEGKVELYLSMGYKGDITDAFYVYVNDNGQKYPLSITNTGGWTTMQEFLICNVDVAVGVNTIVIEANSSNVNLDYLLIKPDNSYVDPDLELVEIKVDASRAKTEFYVGDKFSYDGIVVTGYYSDQSSREITTGYTVSEPDMSVPGNPTVTVSYQDKEAEYTIKVEERPVTDGPTDFVGGIKIYTASLAEVNGCEIQSNNSGTDGKIIAQINANTSFTYTIYSFYTGAVEIILGAAGQMNGGAVTDALALYVNGSETPINITVGTGGWTNFTEIFVCYTELVKGTNTFEFRAVNAGGSVNVDRLVIAEKSIYTGVAHKYGAASATYENCELQSGAGWDGNIYGGIEATGVITYNIHSTLTQAVELRVSVAGGTGSGEWGWTGTQQEAFEMFVNGNSLGKFDVGPTGWTDFKEIVVGYLKLNEGDNTVEIKAVNASFNFNYLYVAPVHGYSGERMVLGASSATAQNCRLQSGYGADGTFIGDISSATTITFTIYSEIEASVNILLYVAGQDQFSFAVSVNGESLNVTTTTGNWTNFEEREAGTVNLKEGSNVIVISTSTGGFNFGHLIISQAQ